MIENSFTYLETPGSQLVLLAERWPGAGWAGLNWDCSHWSIFLHCMCHPSSAVPDWATCASPAWVVLTVEICFPSSCTWLWQVSWAQSSKTCLPSVGGISQLTNQSSKYYCFPFFLTYSCPWTSTTLRMTSTSSRWCWSQGTPNLYVIFYCILTYCLFVCMQLIKFFDS